MRLPILLTAVACLAGPVMAQLAEPPAGVTQGLLAQVPNKCAANRELSDIAASPSWSGWGGAGNARFQTAAAAGISAVGPRSVDVAAQDAL